MKAIVSLLFFTHITLLSNSQNAIVGSGFSAGWGNAGVNANDYSYFSSNISSTYGGAKTATGTGNQYFRLGVDWSSVYKQLTITPGSDTQVSPETEYTVNGSNTSSGAMYYNVPNVSYNYYFKMTNAGTSPTGTFIFFEIQGSVRSISSTSQSPSSVYPGTDVVVTATLDGLLATGQSVYLRYTKDGYSTSNVLAMSYSGSGTDYTATIPGSVVNGSDNFSYYMFTSGDGLGTTLNSTPSKSDLYTITYLNNGGSNYTFTVGANWTSNSDGNWSSGSVWPAGYAPSTSNNLGSIIISNDINLDQDASLTNITVNSTKTLTIDNNYSLTVSGVLTNNGTITIENTGALIQGSSSTIAGSGSFNVNKSGTEASGALRYDFWGSPVTSANVSILGALGGNRYWYNPAAATTDLALGWTAASGTMVVGRGYIATNSGDVTFTGTVNNGEITYAAVTETNSSVNIENIISNPYPSGLDLTLFAAANESASQLTSSFYFWDDKGTAGNYGTDGYATFNSSGATWTAAGFAGASAIPSNNIIASGQGFVVVPGASAPASFNVTFTNSMRAANTSTFYRDGSDRQRFWVQLTKDSTHFSEMAVVVNSDATESYDEQFDSKRLDANNASTSINAYYDNTFVVIKSLPAFSSRKQVPLTVSIAEDGMYKFAVSKSDNIDGLKIFLFDNLTGMAHLISNNNEHLQLLTAGSYFDRFYLVFDEVENAGTAIEEVHTIQYSITPRDIILTNIKEPMSYEVYSLNGQLLEQANLTTNSIDLSTYSTGIYLVKLKTANTTQTIKFARH